VRLSLSTVALTVIETARVLMLLYPLFWRATLSDQIESPIQSDRMLL
jgi:hypothetical protein